MNPDSIDDLFSQFHGPLTAQDIERIEAAFNSFICALFEDKEDRGDHLASDLVDKIEGYISIADYAEKADHLDVGPELGERLRKLLDMVNEYYHRLN